MNIIVPLNIGKARPFNRFNRIFYCCILVIGLSISGFGQTIMVTYGDTAYMDCVCVVTKYTYQDSATYFFKAKLPRGYYIALNTNTSVVFQEGKIDAEGYYDSVWTYRNEKGIVLRRIYYAEKQVFSVKYEIPSDSTVDRKQSIERIYTEYPNGERVYFDFNNNMLENYWQSPDNNHATILINEYGNLKAKGIMLESDKIGWWVFFRADRTLEKFCYYLKNKEICYEF